MSLEMFAEQGIELRAPFDAEEALLEAEERKEEGERLRIAIARLTKRQQYLIKEVYFNRRKQTEIAAETGVTKASVSDAVRRALATLKKFLEKE